MMSGGLTTHDGFKDWISILDKTLIESPIMFEREGNCKTEVERIFGKQKWHTDKDNKALLID